MIQRIQTIYLLLVVILTSVTLFSPIMEFATDSTSYVLSFKGIQMATAEGYKTIGHAWMLTLISAIIPIIAFATIWLYKYRQLQIRLTVFNSLLMLGYYGMFFFFRYFYTEKYAADACVILWPVIFPFISIILNYLAIRGIAKDDAIVKSYDRLR